MRDIAFNQKARVAVGIAADLFGCSIEDLRGPSRKQPITWYRYMVIYLLKSNSQASNSMISDYFNGRYRTVVNEACEYLETWVSTGDEYAELYTELERRFLEFISDPEGDVRPDLDHVSLSIGSVFLEGRVIDLDPRRCRRCAKLEKRSIPQEVSHV